MNYQPEEMDENFRKPLEEIEGIPESLLYNSDEMRYMDFSHQIIMNCIDFLMSKEFDLNCQMMRICFVFYVKEV